MVVPVVVISGLPGSGKSTVGRAVSEAVGLPLLSVDTVKEAIADHLDDPDRLAIRAAARAVVARLAETCPLGCLVDIWINPLRDVENVTALLTTVTGVRLLEVVCRIPPEVAVDRYAARDRHTTHLPPDQGSFARIREAAPHVAPLGLGPAYDLDTAGSLDVTELLRWLDGHGVPCLT